jgi:hypothetical protein
MHTAPLLHTTLHRNITAHPTVFLPMNPRVRNMQKTLLSQPGLRWLKDCSFHLLPYLAICRRQVTPGWGRQPSELSFQVWGSGSITVLSRLPLWLASRLGRTQPRSALELRRRTGYVLVLNLNLDRIGVLSTYRTDCLESVLGNINDTMWKLEKMGEAVC